MPAAARKGDADVPHCSGHNIATASGDVFTNGRGQARRGDVNTTHKKPGKRCPPHSTPISSASPDVFVNNRPAARVGDPFSGCTKIAAGSGDVFING